MNIINLNDLNLDLNLVLIDKNLEVYRFSNKITKKLTLWLTSLFFNDFDKNQVLNALIHYDNATPVLSFYGAQYPRQINIQKIRDVFNKNAHRSVPPSYRDQINQDWKKLFRPSEKLETVAYYYDFSAVIEEAIKAKKQGKKICLVIGRRPSEESPHEAKQAKHNEVWFSADISMLKEDLFHPRANRHFWLDFNDSQTLQALKGMFDSIVIDESTPKELKGDFANQLGILLRSKDSQLMFKADPGYRLDVDEKEHTFNSSKGHGKHFPVQSSVDKAVLIEQHENNLTLHFQNTYAGVELKKNTVYPYAKKRTRPTAINFFIVKGYNLQGNKGTSRFIN